jgi:hypothetical protein
MTSSKDCPEGIDATQTDYKFHRVIQTPGVINDIVSTERTTSKYAKAYLGTGSATLYESNGVTVSMWMKVSSGATKQAVMSWQSGSQKDVLSMVVDVQGRIATYIGGKTSLQTSLTGIGSVANTQRVNDGNWHHLCLTYKKNKQSALYVDGNKEVEFASAYAMPNTGAVVLGQRQNGLNQVGQPGASFEASESFVGSISEAKMYSAFFNEKQCQVAAMSGQNPSDDAAVAIRPRVPWLGGSWSTGSNAWKAFETVGNMHTRSPSKSPAFIPDKSSDSSMALSNQFYSADDFSFTGSSGFFEHGDSFQGG